MVQPFPRSQKMQSPFPFSRRVRPRCPAFVYRPTTSSMVSPRNSAMAATSSSSTQTKPGSPVQQSPHIVQVKRRPSLYQGSLTSASPPGGHSTKNRSADGGSSTRRPFLSAWRPCVYLVSRGHVGHRLLL